ncbi:MAG: alpha/beta hydrolase [Pseudomonadota bacterium]
MWRNTVFFWFVIALALASCTKYEGAHDASSMVLPGGDAALLTPSLERLAIPNAPADAISERGTLRVPVNRSVSSGQALDLEFFRFKRLAEADPDTPPIFLLRGGPGYPGLGDAVESEAFYERAILRYTRLTDLVIIGQRGFGSSGDLSCPGVARSPYDEVDTSEKSRARYRRTAEMCRDHYLQQGLDLSGYNIKEMADDVADVATSLGYQSIQLKGSSFGAFWSIAVLRQHPDLVERATLSALEGPDHTIDRPTAVKTTLTNIANAAAQSERYQERIPEEGLIDAYQSTIDAADREPFVVSFDDEETGASITINIDGDALRRFSYGVTNRPNYRYVMHDWPDDLLNIIEGNFDVVAPLLYRYSTGTDADSAAEEIIECSSGISPERRAEIAQDPAIAFVGTPALLDERICDLWGEAVVDMDRSDFDIDVPTLLISGTWDISTPYDQAKTVRQLFRDHHFVTVEGGSHGAIFEAEETDPAFLAALFEWYVTGSKQNLPDVVELPALDWQGGN